MSGKNERQAHELLDEYISAARSGKRPSADTLLQRCREDQREELRLALEGVDFAMQNYPPLLASDELVERTVHRFTQVKERRRRSGEARSRFEQQRYPLLRAEGILDFLQSVFGVQLEIGRSLAGKPAPQVLLRGKGGHVDSALVTAIRNAAAERRAGEHAQLLLGRFGSPGPPIDPRSVAEWLGLVVIEQEVEGCDGCVVMEGDIAGILVNAAITSHGRKRFTVAHELGHYSLHNQHIAFRRELLREIEDESAGGIEAEANAFAAELLMPRDSVAPRFAHSVPTFAAVEQIAGDYLVSQTAAAVRLTELSDYACALVCTMQGRVRWVVRSGEWSTYFIATGGPPPRYSQAGALLAGELVKDRYEDCPAIWWAPDHRRGEEAELSEHSRRVSEDCILTLLYDAAAG
jgi:hypothetical protein